MTKSVVKMLGILSRNSKYVSFSQMSQSGWIKGREHQLYSIWTVYVHSPVWQKGHLLSMVGLIWYSCHSMIMIILCRVLVLTSILLFSLCTVHIAASLRQLLVLRTLGPRLHRSRKGV